MIMNYTEEDLRKAFRAGVAYKAECNGFFGNRANEDEYINSLKPKEVEEDLISFTYSFLRRKLDWVEFCVLTGVNYYARSEGYEIKDNEVFEILESDAIKFGLL